ncbi:hypothetical protein [Kitasatospora sp. NPDC090091]|uniref:hypothetical protein n=1 Tax=Kitasatospora sp. NPDC090091 TaxID=3364081 RepID=UPI003829EFA3
MQRNQVARLIGAIFGLVFVLTNAAALPSAVGIPLRVLAVLAFLRLFIVLRRDRPADAATGGATAETFGRGYRLVVAAEVAVGLGGLVVLNPVLHLPKASVGWITVVVGLHFFGLAAVWRMPSVHVLAAMLTSCGAAGLALAWADAPAAAIASISGIAPGALLLGAVGWTLRTPNGLPRVDHAARGAAGGPAVDD